MPEPLDAALAALRPQLLDLDTLIRAVASGRLRGGDPPRWRRVELRPVRLKSGVYLQVVLTDGLSPLTHNHAPGADAEAALDAVLAEPFGNWHLDTRRGVVQLRVTKRGQAQVHTTTRGDDPVPGAAGHDRVKEHLLDPGDPLFAAVGAGGDKRRQVDAFLRHLLTVLEPASAAAQRDGRPLHVVDLGCGNAYLTVAAHRYLTGVRSLAVRTVGVDRRPDLVKRNTDLAFRLDLPGLEFVAGSIADAEPFGAGPVDLVLALHACDTATDDALARTARWRAPAVLAAPCCHRDVQRQLEARRSEGVEPPAPFRPLVREPILRQRFADVLTDALRAELMRQVGYRVEVVEFIDSRHTPRNALLRLVRADGGRGGGTAGRAAPAVDPAVDPAADLVGLSSAWQVRPYLLDALGDLVDPALQQRIGHRVGPWIGQRVGKGP